MYLDIKETILKVSLSPFVHLVPAHIPIYVKSYELARYCSLFQQVRRVVL